MAQGEVRLNGVSNSCVYATHRMVVAIGLENIVIAETPDAPGTGR